MYFTPALPNRTQPLGLGGLAQLRNTSDHQKSLDAIRKALLLDPVGGYVPGSLARRQLTAAFVSVPITSACELREELKTGTNSLGKLFRYRLHHLTQKQMLEILAQKCSKQKQQLREAEQKLKQLCAQQQALLDARRAATNKLEISVEKLCQLAGEDSDQCQKARFELFSSKVKLNDNFRSHRLRCLS